MTIASFSVPIDIPWRRIAFSEDMMDSVACDRRLPLRWRSSVAVFDYEPPKEQQRQEGFVVSYLKVACTITGYQPSDREIRIRERLGASGWTHSDQNDALKAAVGSYYACYGAMLEVVVAPHPGEKLPFRDYPYFADFDPKKREMYETVTETGEVMSRSLEDMGVRIGQTTLQSHEVLDKTTVGGALSLGSGSNTGSGSVGHESGTTDISSQQTENTRTSDAQREARETLSHTTQMSQMYHLLNSYHLGTNRAAFFVLPQPHVKQSELTFVNGPRQIEGIQEFMLVVVRPEALQSFCVEAYLETAHLTHSPVYDTGETSRPLDLQFDAPVTENDDHSYFNTVTKPASSPVLTGKIIDTSRGSGGYDIAGSGGYDVLQPVNAHGKFPPDIRFTVSPDHVDVTATIDGFWSAHPPVKYPASLDLHATVYYKDAVPKVAGYRDGLLITARAVCSCTGLDRVNKTEYERGLSVVFEKELVGTAEARPGHERMAMSIVEANNLQRDIHREMLRSFDSADRYPRGEVGLLDSQLVAGMMGVALRNAAPKQNAPVAQWPGVDKKLVKRLEYVAPGLTRLELLEMPLPEQVERFGIEFGEAVTLRRSLADLDAPHGSRVAPTRPEIRVPLLTGLPMRTARRLLLGAGLRLGAVATVDHAAPIGTVTTQVPAAEASVPADTEVRLELASGLSVRLPEVVGGGLGEAACRLRQAGLLSEATIKGEPAPDARVVAIEPPAGTLVTPHGAVTLRLGRANKRRAATPN